MGWRRGGGLWQSHRSGTVSELTHQEGKVVLIEGETVVVVVVRLGDVMEGMGGWWWLWWGLVGWVDRFGDR